MSSAAWGHGVLERGDVPSRSALWPTNWVETGHDVAQACEEKPGKCTSTTTTMKRGVPLAGGTHGAIGAMPRHAGMVHPRCG